VDLKNEKPKVKALLKQGVALSNLGKDEEALKAFEKAIEINPTDPEAWYNKGVALGKLGKNEEALKAFEKAIEINPTDPEAWYNKGVTLSKLGKDEEALKAFEKAIEINPNYDKAWYNKGVALGKLGKDEEALKAYEKAIEINPNYDKAWNNKGNALSNLGKNEEALKAFEKAIEINPNYDKAWNNKGNALSNLGKNEEALKAYEKAIEINPNYDKAWYNKGVALGKLGKNEEALKAFEKAIEINPTDPEAWYNKGNALSNLGKNEEALKAFEKAIEINPTDPEAWYNKGVTLSKLGKNEEALKAFEKAIEINPTDPEAWYNKGVTLSNLGKNEEALKAFEKAIEINPNYDKAWYNKGVTLSELGKHEKAIEYLAKAYSLLKEISGENLVLKPAKGLGEVDELRVIETGPTDAKWVRVALVQIDFQLSYDKPPKEFGYTLLNNQSVKTKVLAALSLAQKEEVKIIVFPELCTDEHWVDEVREQFKDMVVIFGSYYKKAYNECPVIINGQPYYVQKINPSPHHEKPVAAGRCMKSGKDRFIFHTKYGRFLVLICQDFYDELYKLFSRRDKGESHVDFVIVPSFNKAVERYQKRADEACQDDNFPYILIANALRVDNEKAGGTCIIGTDHDGALKRYQDENLKPKDEIKYKLIEANGERIIIADLDIETKGVPVPARECKMQNAKIIEIPRKSPNVKRATKAKHSH
jgi:tetratricopeptide (TPR) repeat protein